jgi:hypothetical protein
VSYTVSYREYIDCIEVNNNGTCCAVAGSIEDRVTRQYGLLLRAVSRSK